MFFFKVSVQKFIQSIMIGDNVYFGSGNSMLSVCVTVDASSIEGKAKRFVSLSHFGVLSADVQRSNSIPESGETPIWL